MMKFSSEFTARLGVCFKIISELPPADFESLLVAFGCSTPSFSVSKQARRLSFDAIPVSDLSIIIEVLSSLYGAHYSTRSSSEGNMGGFLNRINQKLLEEHRVRSESLDRIEELLCLETPFLAGKAYSVMTDYDRIFLDSNILTDIRPIFKGFSIDKGDIAATVYSHILKLSTSKNGKERNSYVAMDINDLMSLKADIDSAINKELKMRDFLEEKQQLLSFHSEDLIEVES